MSEAQDPSKSLDSELNHAARLLASQPAVAARIARELLQAFPGHPRPTLLLGMAERNLGGLASSLSILEPLARAEPNWAPALYELGITQGKSGLVVEALESLRRAVQLQPNIGEAWRQIAEHLLDLGDPAGADRAFANHLAVSTASRQLLAPAAALCAERYGDAEDLLLAHLGMNPTDVTAMRMLAEVGARIGREDDSITLLSQCLQLAPDYVPARHNFAVLLHKQGRTIEAIAEIDKLLAVDPRNPSYLNLKANALTGIGEYGKAIETFSTVLANYPDNPKIWLAYGHALKTAGQLAKSIESYRHSITLAPTLGEAYWSLANLKRYRFSREDVAEMRAQLARADLSGEDRLHFEFALGKALEDEADYAESFRHYADGNRLRRAGIQYKAEEIDEFVRRSRQLLTNAFFEQRKDWGCHDRGPIFIVGLPRSGSTLVEQILSSHSMVEGTMELPDVYMIARSLADESGVTDLTRYLDALPSQSAGSLRALGERYLRQTANQRKSGAPFFIDKMPNNWTHVGFIHLMLPNARIIDARRHPLSCCFSNFKQNFARGQHFTYSLEDIGRFYCNYVELMAHYDAALPARVHRVVYEQIVDDTESEVRRLLEYCGLPFEDACLRFYENKRAVRTPSSEQVRQPIFREGIDQWRHYEQWLGPLKEVLGPVLDSYPAAPPQ